MNFLLRKSGVLAVVLIIGVYAFVANRGPNGLPALLEKRRVIAELQEQNATLAADNQRKRARIEKLKNSPAEQELEIREKLGLGKEGETQFILPDAPQQDPAPAPATK